MDLDEKTSLKEGEERWLVLEYESLRRELNSRVIYLYKIINLAVFLWVVFLGMLFVFWTLEVKKEIIITFLLFVPIIIDLVAFVYQTNQNSLESVARYIHFKIKPRLDKKYKVNMLGWEKFFAKEKRPFQYESVTKVFPFVLPSIIPIYLLLAGQELAPYQITLTVVDLVLLVIMIENFRYKLRRVK